MYIDELVKTLAERGTEVNISERRGKRPPRKYTRSYNYSHKRKSINHLKTKE